MNSSNIIQSPIFESIRHYLNKSNEDESIFLFVPYIKTKVLEKLVEGIPNKITIITTWDTNDLISGSSDIELYNWCKENGNYLYIHDHIHLKVYSVNLESAIVGSGNISRNGLMPGGNYEAAVFVNLTKEDRRYLEKIKNEARFVDDDVYQQYLENYNKFKEKAVKQEPFPQPEIKSKEEFFLRSALPMTDSMELVIQGYLNIESDLEPSEDKVVADCIYHDIANFKIPDKLSESEVRNELKKQFLSHPFTRTIMEEIDNNERKHFGMIKNWIRDHCTEVPLPRPWEFNTNTKILMNWLVESGEYEKFRYGEHTESIRRINQTSKNIDPNEYENKVLEILAQPGKTIEEIRIIYDQDPHLKIHDMPSDPNELDYSSESVWHFKAEMDEKIIESFSLSEEEIGERNSRGKLYKKIAGIMGKLNEEKIIKMWYYEQKGSSFFSDGVWRLTDKGKEEIQKRGIQTAIIQNPISKFNIGKFYHHDEIWKPLGLGFSGGIRVSVKNKLVILFWNAPSEDIQNEKDDEFGRGNIYEDSYDEKTGFYRYIGEGREGNQTITRGNKAIVDAKQNGRTIHLFHQHEEDGKHEYLGEMELVGNPETQIHQDINENEREELVFLLKPKNNLEIIGEIDAYWEGRLRKEHEIVGDGYTFEGDEYDVIVVGDEKGIYKNDKKMTREEYEKLPMIFRSSLRLEPEWDD